jgi:hypothetical protein
MGGPQNRSGCYGKENKILPLPGIEPVSRRYTDSYLIFPIRIVEVVGPLATAATNRPIVAASDDYEDGEIGGMMTGRGN